MRVPALKSWLLCLCTAFCCQTGQAACNVSATAVAFGIYDPLSGSPDDSTGTINVHCTFLLALPLSYEVRLSTGGSGSYAARTLASGGNTLSYNLYTSASHATVWGDGSGGTGTVSFSSLGLLSHNRNYTVYGRLPAGQDAAVGSYSDTITVTLDY